MPRVLSEPRRALQDERQQPASDQFDENGAQLLFDNLLILPRQPRDLVARHHRLIQEIQLHQPALDGTDDLLGHSGQCRHCRTVAMPCRSQAQHSAFEQVQAVLASDRH
ncbi:hypothetical protein D3C85_1398250 [compost metagenome]